MVEDEVDCYGYQWMVLLVEVWIEMVVIKLVVMVEDRVLIKDPKVVMFTKILFFYKCSLPVKEVIVIEYFPSQLNWFEKNW